MNEKKQEYFKTRRNHMILGIFIIIGVLFLTIINFDNLKETKINKTDCYDKEGSKIIGLKCEKIEFVHPLQCGIYLISIMIGCIIFILGHWFIKK